MEKIANILTKVAAIVLLVVGVLALIGNVVTIINVGFDVLALVMALVYLACGVLLLNFAKKSNALYVVIMLAIALVVILVDRFAIGGFALTSVIFAYISADFAFTMINIMSILMIILAVDVAAALVLKVIPMVKK